MKLKGILPFARFLLDEFLQEGDTAVDATCGNGNDTLYLAKKVGKSGSIFGFDIQEQAIENTGKKLREHNENNQVTLVHASHASIKAEIPEVHHGRVKAAIFNLGYLPGGDKEVVTSPASTLKAVEQLLEIMAKVSILILVIYSGHPEGKVEKDKVLKYAMSLDQKNYHVLQYNFINQKNDPPFIIAIEKR
ncbi:class I SAM-dependent methyltransferase [Pseudalkalibacillus caeni]|uniref:Methyltransferase domain-containing protein n=1 Tax=Exobacillus caeni TaxID=2574798 RepID=A0A5R9F9T9_9BACL|nr:class I SAM-dependent methyltransferase [Pseudalkalibacillus caeni]TLS39036.1 methyltransferase domain-containing protein [Pseudalkalibacillus caeni]